MQKHPDVGNWIDFWKATKNFPAKKSVRDQAQAWNERWNRLPDGMPSRKMAMGRRKRMARIFEMLDVASFSLQGSRILDIASGPGAVSIPFAHAGATVTALDISGKALERLHAEAEQHSLSIKTLECSWHAANIDKLGLRNGFDLVFAANTPALKEPRDFERMIACSNNICYYEHTLHSGGHLRMKHPAPLLKILNGAQAQRIGSEMSWFLYGFMYLYLSGYRPLLKIDSHKRRAKLGWEEAASRIIQWREHTRSGTASLKRKLREYFQGTAVDGMCGINSEGYSGRMVWKVKL